MIIGKLGEDPEQRLSPTHFERCWVAAASCSIKTVDREIASRVVPAGTNAAHRTEPISRFSSSRG